MGGVSPVALSAWPVPKPSDWLTLVNEPQTEAELAAIRRSVLQGRPYGASNWVKQTAPNAGLETHTARALGTNGIAGRLGRSRQGVGSLWLQRFNQWSRGTPKDSRPNPVRHGWGWVF